LGLNKIDARVFVGNAQSRRAFEKNGFRLEGTLRSAGRKRGKVFDDWLLGKLGSEHCSRGAAPSAAPAVGLEFNALVPELLVFELARSLAFYVELVGFRVEYTRTQPEFAFLSFGESQLMLERDSGQPAWQVEPLDAPRGRGLNLSIHCLDAQGLAERLLRAGVTLRLPLEDRWYRCGEATLGERHFLVQDPDGYLLRFAQDLGART
jgi:catechol 2,3-dioxygenase-like lactoylglutathione lyase family enzyme